MFISKILEALDMQVQCKDMGSYPHAEDGFLYEHLVSKVS